MSSVPFSERHLGPSRNERQAMAEAVGFGSVEELVDAAVPGAIRSTPDDDGLPEPMSEEEATEELRRVMGRNRVARSLIGMGYADCVVPPVIRRNVLENPGWYTAYTPYQAEIAQGRLEALLNFQTMVCELTGLDVANASLLDEGTAVAEAVALAQAPGKAPRPVFVSSGCHPQTIDVVETRCRPLGIEVVVGDHREIPWSPGGGGFSAVVVQYPTTTGDVPDYSGIFATARANGALGIAAADLLSLTLLKPPGEIGADVAVGSAQRFGVPLGFGGPHAAFMAVRDNLKRRLPGRLVGASRDRDGATCYRLALQTREQHIRRDKATSNICTAQVLLAVMASMYAVYHGPAGLRAIALRVSALATRLRAGLQTAGLEVTNRNHFDTLTVGGVNAANVCARAVESGINLRRVDDHHVGVTLDERSDEAEIETVLRAFGVDGVRFSGEVGGLGQVRQSPFLQQPVFNRYHTETEMLRYLHRLERKDVALNRSMIPLGSCTMKLNATAEMEPLSWPEVAGLHPFVPADQSEGYRDMARQLESWLGAATGFPAVSLQPNAGSQGEFAGLLAIRGFHESRNDGARDVCLIPTSAHGTNPASAVMAGMRVVPVGCDTEGNIDLADLAARVDQHRDRLAALMVTYPSTHGVFETTIRNVCETVHAAGGQVYMDGANMNAQVGLTSPAAIGADVCHLNLHKTFCIPHGGGGPGVGPVAAAAHLAPFLPGHRFEGEALGTTGGAVCSAPWGSTSITTISWMYIAMMGAAGLAEATRVAILNANYVAHRLAPFYPVLYKGENGLVAHECIIDLRGFKAVGVEVEDVAKRLIDYGYHAPTMSWPVPGTLMIEPTESESRAELDRFCEAMVAIHGEIAAVESGASDPADNVLKNAPHTAAAVASDSWGHPYSREQAAFPLPWLREDKYWPPVARVDNVYGDRNLVCTCPGVEELAQP